MKKFITILLISAILTGCGHISEDKPYVAEETTTASQITETTASDAIDTTTSAETVTSEVTVEKSSQSVTAKTAESVTTAAANTDIQPKNDNTKSHTAQDNKAQEVQRNESKTTTKLSDFEALEYESEISGAIEAYQSDEEENRGIMAYLGDRKRFSDKVYSIFPSVEKVGDRLMGVFICQICGELDSYEYDELLQELRGQASDGWAESFEQHEMS